VPSTVQPVVVTRDLARLQAFYSSLLGAAEVGRVPDDGAPFFVRLQVGNSELGLVSNTGAAATAGRVLLSIEVDSVDALLPRVAALGGQVTGGPTDMPWGQRVLHIADPDGNPVNLTQPL
jgi:predicted enzyme related to lactoylglutathione lyase